MNSNLTLVKPLVASLIAAFALTACKVDIDSDAIKGSGKIITQKREVTSFDGINNSSPFDIEVSEADALGVEVVGDDNLIAEVETIVQGNTLIIRSKRKAGLHLSMKHTPLTIKISMPVLHSLNNSGSGDMNLHQLHGDKLSFQLSGSGDLKAEGVVKELTIDAQGSGDMDLTNLQLGQAKIDLSGSGSAHFKQLSHSLEASLSGSGDLRVDQLAVEQSDISMHGSGEVKLSGNSAQLKLKINGSGDFEGDKLNTGNTEIHNSGSSNVTLNTNSGNLTVSMSGSGDFEAMLKQAGDLNFMMNGSGSTNLQGSAKI